MNRQEGRDLELQKRRNKKDKSSELEGRAVVEEEREALKKENGFLFGTWG